MSMFSQLSDWMVAVM